MEEWRSQTQRWRNVLPDKRIDPVWADFSVGRDAVLDWIMELAR